MFKCSIIVAVYNKTAYLDDFFYALSSQGLEDKEVILIDDKSSDDSLNKCVEFASAMGGGK